MALWGDCSNSSDAGNPAGCIPLGTACLTIVSCSLSVIGCLVIFVEFLFSKPKTASKWILVWISVSDLMISAGFIFSTSFFIDLTLDTNTSTLLPPQCSKDKLFCDLCMAQSFITTMASMQSFFWTTILAVHLFLCVVLRSDKLSRRMMPTYHVVAWTIGLVITIVVIAIDYLGTGDGRVSVSWCFIKQNILEITLALEFVAGKFWEILSYILLFILYIVMVVVLCRRKREGGYRADTPLVGVELKFVLIPVSFVLIRMWGTIRFFIGFQLLTVSKNDTARIMEVEQQIRNPFLVNMQAFGDGAQGWVNALIFVVFSSKLLEAYKKVCCWYCQRQKQPTHVIFGGADAARHRSRQHPRRIEEANRVLIPPGRGVGSAASSPRSFRSSGGYGAIGQRNRSTLLGSGDHVTTPVPSDNEKR